MKLVPRTGRGLLWRALLASVLVIGCAAATTAVAGLLEVNNIVQKLRLGGTINNVKHIVLPAPGAPETLLLIGADRRIGEGKGYGNSDTMILVRIDDDSSSINVLSIPRDLLVHTSDGGIEKINAAYSEGGPSGLLSVLKGQVFPQLKVNHVFVISFLGFSRLIDAIGCVYTMVDHRYYNNTAQTGYSSINIQPGYQRLCGWDASPNGALAFVRFRHTDSDLVRETRQQDFLRWAKDNFSTADLVDERAHLVDVFGKNVDTDKYLQSDDGLIILGNLLINVNGHTIKSFPFPVTDYPTIDEAEYVASTSALEKKTYREFITPTKIKPKSPPKQAATAPKRRKHKLSLSTAGLTSDTGDGLSQAAHLGHMPMPVYYPKLIESGSSYCYSITGNCNEEPNPASEYTDSYPRRYSIKAPNGKRYKSYAFTLQLPGDPVAGQYYTVQGTTWRDPPILRAKVARVVKVHGRKLDVYENGGKVSLVSMDTRNGIYWIANTLTDDLSNSEMVAIAASLSKAPEVKRR